MNRTYRNLWNAALGAWVAAPETARGHGGGLSRRCSRIAVGGLGVLALVGVLAGPASAATRYWDINGNTAGVGGTGTWDTTSAFWNTSATGTGGTVTAWNNSNLDTATFAGTAGTVTLGVPITVGNVTFTVTNYTLTGSTLTLGGVTPTITSNTGVSATVSSILAGTAGLTKAGAGTLTLNGANTFTGDLKVNAGILSVNGDAALGNASNGVVMASGTQFGSTGALAASRVVTLTGGKVTLTGAGVGSARFTGAGGVSALAGVTLRNNADDYTGQTQFAGVGGTYSFSSVRDLGVASALGAPTTVANGTILVAPTSGSAILTYTGTGDSSNRNWAIQNPSGGQTLFRNAGSGTLTLTGNIAQTGTGITQTTFSATGGDLALLGVISNGASPASIVFNGSAGRTITLGGANTWTGGTSVSGVTVMAPVLADQGVASSFGTAAAAISTIGITANGMVSYTGAGASTNRAWNISSGTLSNDGSGALALSGAMAITGTATLGGSFSGVANSIASVISGTGALAVNGTGTWMLTGANTYTGGTTISAGTLQLGNGGTTGSIVGDITDNGTLAFNRSDAVTFAGAVSGAGTLSQSGSGTTTLSGNSGAFSGGTSVTDGTLFVNGTLGSAGSTTSVSHGGTIGGTGTLGGSVSISDGVLAPGDAPGTLTINGDLSLTHASTLNYEFGQPGVAGGPLNDLTVVGGNLTLAGTLNVAASPGGTFSPGVYRIFQYGGTLTDQGLTLGSVPTPNLYVQTSVTNQVNLVNTTGLTLNYWDGALGPKNNGVVNGGNGIWQGASGNDNWSDASGTVNAPFSNGAFAVFMAQPGHVTVDNSLGQAGVSGMQFASDGYSIDGGSIVLTGSPDSTIRVGDGSAAGAGYTATIDSVLAGTARLVKTDLGTLVLGGSNTYTGGTAINGGVLQVAGDASLGAATGTLSFDGGTLRTTATFSTARDTTLNAAGGTFETQTGTFTQGGIIAGTGALTKTGTGTLSLTADNSYTGGTTVAAGILQLGNGGTSGAITGNVTDNGTLAFNRSDVSTFAGVISGAGSLVQAGTGTTVLNAASSYGGSTSVAAGTLVVGDAAHANATLGTGPTTVAGGTVLGGYGIVPGSVTNAGTISVASALPVLAAGAQGAFTITGDLQNLGMANLAAVSGQTGNVLNVRGNYIGSNGQLALNTRLNEGGTASQSDQLVVGGNATGNTGIVVHGSGTGAQTVGDGIELVQVHGTSTANSFQLSRPVQAGAYQYLLYQGGAGGAANWYLRSSLEEALSPPSEPGSPVGFGAAVAYRPEVAGYSMTPLLNVDYGFSVLGQLLERVGDIASIAQKQYGNQDGIWGRIGGQSLNADTDRFAADDRTFFAQFGKDWTLAQSPGGGSTHAGVTVTIGSSSSSFDDNLRALNPTLSNSTGTAVTQAQTLGGYYTKYLADSSYSDSVVQVTHYHNHYGDIYGGEASQNGYGIALSEELGKPFQIASTQVAIEPQAQLMYQYVNLGGFNDQVSSVSSTVTNALRGRIGIRLFHASLDNDARTSAATPYFTADILHDFLSPGETTVGGTAIPSALGKTWYELGVGVTASYGQAGEMYASVKYQRNLGEQYRQGVMGQVGYRYSW